MHTGTSWKDQVNLPSELSDIDNNIAEIIEFAGIIYLGGCGIMDRVERELGIRGISIGGDNSTYDSLFRLGTYWINKLGNRARGVIVSKVRNEAPELIEVNRNNIEIQNISSNNISKGDQYLERWFSSKENAKYNKIQNILGIEYVCRNLSIPFIDGTELTEFELIRRIKNDIQ